MLPYCRLKGSQHLSWLLILLGQLAVTHAQNDGPFVPYLRAPDFLCEQLSAKTCEEQCKIFQDGAALSTRFQAGELRLAYACSMMTVYDAFGRYVPGIGQGMYFCSSCVVSGVYQPGFAAATIDPQTANSYAGLVYWSNVCDVAYYQSIAQAKVLATNPASLQGIPAHYDCRGASGGAGPGHPLGNGYGLTTGGPSSTSSSTGASRTSSVSATMTGASGSGGGSSSGSTGGTGSVSAGHPAALHSVALVFATLVWELLTLLPIL